MTTSREDGLSIFPGGRKCSVNDTSVTADTDLPFYSSNVRLGPHEFVCSHRTNRMCPSLLAPASPECNAFSLDSKFINGFGLHCENLASKFPSFEDTIPRSRQRTPQHGSVKSRRLSGSHQLMKFNERNESSSSTRLPGCRRSTCDILPPPVNNRRISTSVANSTLIHSTKPNKVESSLCRQGSGGASRRKKRQLDRPPKQCHDVIKFLSLSREYAESLNCIVEKAEELCRGGVLERSSKAKLDQDFVVAERSWLTHIADLLAKIRNRFSSQASAPPLQAVSLQGLPLPGLPLETLALHDLPNCGGNVGNHMDCMNLLLHPSDRGSEGDNRTVFNFNGLAEVISSRIFCNEMPPATSSTITSSLLASLLDAISLQASLCHMSLKMPEEPALFQLPTADDHPSLSVSEKGNADLGHVEADEGEGESNFTRSSSRTVNNRQTSVFTSLEIPQIDLDNLLQPVNKRGVDWDAPQQPSVDTSSTPTMLSKRFDDELTLMDNVTRYHSYTAPRVALLNRIHSREADDCCINPLIRGNIRQELFSRVRANRSPKRSKSLGVSGERPRSCSDIPPMEPFLLNRLFSLDDVDLRPTWMKTPRLFHSVMTKLAQESQVVARKETLSPEIRSTGVPSNLRLESNALHSDPALSRQVEVLQFYIEWNILGLQTQLDHLRSDSRLVSPEFHPVSVGKNIWPISTPLRMMLIFEFEEEASSRSEQHSETRDDVAVGIYFTLAGDIEVSYRLFHGSYLSERKSHSFKETPWTGVTPSQSGIVMSKKLEKGTVLTVGLIIDNIRPVQPKHRTKDLTTFSNCKLTGTPACEISGAKFEAGRPFTWTTQEAATSQHARDALRPLSLKEALDFSGDLILKRYRNKTKESQKVDPGTGVTQSFSDTSLHDQTPSMEMLLNPRFHSHFPTPSVPSEWLRKIFSETTPTAGEGATPINSGDENLSGSKKEALDSLQSNHINLSSTSLSSMSSPCRLPSVLTILSNCGRTRSVVDGSFSFLSENGDEIDNSSFLLSRPDGGRFVDG